jgi:hypothetical protein
MKIWSDSFRDGAPIPPRYALGKPDPKAHATFSDNVSPHLAWSDLPAGTRSLALVCVDVDVPTVGDDVNQEGRIVPADLMRTDFYHWVIVDLDPASGPIAEGEFSRGVTPRGKSGPAAARGTRAGLNDYTGWFKGDADLEGQYFGYDGPWPPWNDSVVHHYHFRLYALDVPRCPVEGVFTGADAISAMAGHVLGEGFIVGTYAINPAAKDTAWKP